MELSTFDTGIDVRYSGGQDADCRHVLGATSHRFAVDALGSEYIVFGTD